MHEPEVFTHLAAGTHRVSLRGIHRLGNVGPAVTSRFSVARLLRVSKRGTVVLRVSCPAKFHRCEVTQRLSNGRKTVASRTLGARVARPRR